MEKVLHLVTGERKIVSINKAADLPKQLKDKIKLITKAKSLKNS